MDALALFEIADMCGGVLQGPGASRTIRRISKDTRTLIPGDLYLALRGENHDGNLYAKTAAEKGAAGAILDATRPDLPDSFPVIYVENALSALHRLAAAWRDRLALKVACVTGSSGKTTTKEFTAAVLSPRYRVVKTEGNLNNHIGLPLSILSASITDDAAVWEIGMNHPGEIAPLARLARPDIAIITNIGVAHIEYMGSRASHRRRKGRAGSSRRIPRLRHCSRRGRVRHADCAANRCARGDHRYLFRHGYRLEHRDERRRLPLHGSRR